VYQVYITCVCEGGGVYQVYIMCVCVGGGVDRVEVRLKLRPSSSTGVLFALVSNSSAPLTIAVVTQGENEAVGRNRRRYRSPPPPCILEVTSDL